MSANIYDSTAKKLIPFAGNSEATAGSLDGLSDVNISSPTDGQVLTYDATNDVWVNEEGAAVIESLGDIADVDLTNLEDGQTIVWDATEEKWVPGTSGTSLTAGFGVSIENDEIKTTDFVGTQAQWDALTPTQKESYDFVHITDDSSDVSYSPGHAISDGTTEKTQREVLEFEGFTVTDDSVNGKTKVAEVPYTAGDGVEITNKEIAVSDEISRTWTGTKAEWDAIADKSIYDGWIINITDDYASGVGVVVDTVEDGNMNAVTSNAVAEAINNSVLKKMVIYTASESTGKTYAELVARIDSLIGSLSSEQLINSNLVLGNNPLRPGAVLPDKSAYGWCEEQVSNSGTLYVLSVARDTSGNPHAWNGSAYGSLNDVTNNTILNAGSEIVLYYPAQVVE